MNPLEHGEVYYIFGTDAPMPYRMFDLLWYTFQSDNGVSHRFIN